MSAGAPIPLEAIDGLEEVVSRWLAERLLPVHERLDFLADELAGERIDRQAMADELRDSIAALSRELDSRTERFA